MTKDCEDSPFFCRSEPTNQSGHNYVTVSGIPPMDSENNVHLDIYAITANSSSNAGSSEDELHSDTNESMVTLLRDRMLGVRLHIQNIYHKDSGVKSKVFCGFVSLLYIGYFLWAIILDPVRALPLIAITSITAVFIGCCLLRRFFGKFILVFYIKTADVVESNSKYIKWVVGVIVVLGVVGVLVEVALKRPTNLISLGGLFSFLTFLYLFSYKRSQVSWRPVAGGFFLQFILALLILRWDYGYEAFKFLGKSISSFLSYTDVGSKFVFGEKFVNHPFAFQILPVIVFFSCIISVLYYVGVMQIIIGAIAWVMHVTLGTTAAESLSAAGNIFVGQTEAPILIRPFLELMTRSELHAVMTGGFATIAGGVLAAYIKIGVPAEHLICASVMNAASALAVSKLFYPETEVSKLKSKKDIPMPKRTERNIIEAAATGASTSISLVANIAANLIAFLALLAFVDSALSWLGGFVDHQELSFKLICSYVFRPVAFLMGVDWKDAPLVGELIGIKIFLNEFVAYEKMGEFIENRLTGNGLASISKRSEIIATYALCGFANLSSVGVQLGGIGPMAPSRRGDLAQIALRALTAGTVACFITASIAGILVIEENMGSSSPGNLTYFSNLTFGHNDSLPLNITGLYL